MRRSTGTLVAIVFGTGLIAVGCSTQLPESEVERESTAAALPKVATTRPVRKTITQKTVQPGRIEAFNTTPIHVKIGGYVDRILVDIGDRVTGPKRNADGQISSPGQILAVLSSPELDEEYRQKQAMVAQVEAEVLQAEAAVSAHRLNTIAGNQNSIASKFWRMPGRSLEN